jgi:hypothetical protein
VGGVGMSSRTEIIWMMLGVSLAVAGGWWMLAPASTPTQPLDEALAEESAAPPDVSLPSFDVLPPAPRELADLGPGEPVQVPLEDGSRLSATLWRTADLAPVLVMTSGAEEDPGDWLEVARVVRASRAVSLLLVGHVAEGGKASPGVASDPVARQVQAAVRLRAVFGWLALQDFAKDMPWAVLSSREAADAAMTVVGGEAKVRATVLLSPTAAAPTDDLAMLERRQVFVACAGADTLGDATARALEATLQNRRVERGEGAAKGLELLQQSRVKASLAGWLYAALGTRP